MISKAAVASTRRGAARVLACWALACLLMCITCSPAFAYYNRGSVSVALGVTEVQVQAGSSASVTVSITPASDGQTEGCGMPKCPQSCASTCTDENGQCRCSGSEYATYYPSAAAVSSNSAVAVAVYRGGTLTVYGKQEGEAVITVRASLRQFTDAQASLTVRVEGEAADAETAGLPFEDIPQEAEAVQEDRLDVAEKTVMGRPVVNVRLGDSCNEAEHLAAMAGVDGEVIFWQGDTYYHPLYSLSFKGGDYTADDALDIDASLNVTTQAEGVLNQPLYGLSRYVVVDFAQRGALPAEAVVYAQTGDALAEGEAVALFSYDEAGKAFVREEAQPSVMGGYAVFSVNEGKTYVVSSHDLVSDAASIVVGGAGSSAQGESCCTVDGGAAAPVADASGSASASAVVPPVAYVFIGAAITALVAVVVAVVVSRRKRATSPEEGRGRDDARKDEVMGL